MGRVRIKKNELPKIIRRLPEIMDREVDASGDELAPLIAAAVRRRTGTTAATTRNYTPGQMHTTVGVGIHEGRAFYVRFWEWGTSRPNLYGIIVPAERPVGKSAQFFEPVYAERMTRAVRRAVT